MELDLSIKYSEKLVTLRARVSALIRVENSYVTVRTVALKIEVISD